MVVGIRHSFEHKLLFAWYNLVSNIACPGSPSTVKIDTCLTRGTAETPSFDTIPGNLGKLMKILGSVKPPTVPVMVVHSISLRVITPPSSQGSVR